MQALPAKILVLALPRHQPSSATPLHVIEVTGAGNSAALAAAAAQECLQVTMGLPPATPPRAIYLLADGTRLPAPTGEHTARLQALTATHLGWATFDQAFTYAAADCWHQALADTESGVVVGRVTRWVADLAAQRIEAGDVLDDGEWRPMSVAESEDIAAALFGSNALAGEIGDAVRLIPGAVPEQIPAWADDLKDAAADAALIGTYERPRTS